MSIYQNTPKRNRGFSLVEIMIGMVISLISMVIILQVFASFEGQKRTTTSGSDAQTNGAIATYTIERDVMMAGYGLSVPGALGCPINSSFNGAARPTMTLAPVTITKGAGGLPDTITLLSSDTGSWSIPARIIQDHPATATNFFLDTTLGMTTGDILIAYEPGLPCTLLQITGIPNGNIQIHHQNTSPWDPPGGQNIFPPGGYTTQGMLLNLGRMTNRTYSIDPQYNLTLSDYNAASNTTSTLPIMSDIVNLQAEYGFDNRVGTLTDAEVGDWKGVMEDADGDGVTGDSDDIRRIYAIRLAIAARSSLKEKPDPTTGLCNITTLAPTWGAGVNQIRNIDVSRNPDGTANPDWQCYRYKIFETVIPLRNMIWGQ